MATVVAEFTMSLDGFVADPSDGVDQLFGWYGDGEIAVHTARPDMTWHASAASASHLRRLLDEVGAVVAGRRLFDLTDGWKGRHPLGVPVFVVTHSVPEDWEGEHPDASLAFVTDGIESAVAQASAVAGDAVVGVGGPDLAQQCLNAGLLDEVRVDLAPVLLGDGIRFFDNLTAAPLRLERTEVIEGTSVTHLYYRVLKP